jgi:beta-lactamase superfamily II metal-dependent hydrolase
LTAIPRNALPTARCLYRSGSTGVGAFIDGAGFIAYRSNQLSTEERMSDFKYAAVNEAIVYASVVNNKGKKAVNRLLMGTYVAILSQQGDWCEVKPFGTHGWMHKDSLTDTMGLKIFFLDVGQGDGVLIEVGKYRILIDAGPNNSMHNYLTKWQYTYLLKAGHTVHIDFLIVSHFDTDHYRGFISILKNKSFTFGTILHPGILKFAAKNNPYDTGLGDTVKQEGVRYLTRIFDNLLTARSPVPFNRDVTAFMSALQTAHLDGRVSKAERCAAGDVIINRMIDGQNFRLDVLAPILEKTGNKKAFLYWIDDGKTVNGHSLVLKLTYGSRTVLLGGDLNTASQNYLIDKYAAVNPFEVDVAKACHHGSSDFTEDFMKRVNPYATVISSGDNEGHAHPRADAIGCAGRYSKSRRPLVYSTELARSTNLKKNTILFGMINLRCNGRDIFMSQMKEVKNSADLWDSYEVK